jgi:RNA polymerase sigma factor (sigma-70 family)
MATSQMSGVILHLRRAVLLREGAGQTDGQLLTDYISRHDEAALESLVQRHGPMVWGVCRRVLGNHHDAEDAFQATFLVLVRKAASIASRELLANWLYGVAHQTALKARATVAKRKVRERQVTEMPEPAVVEQDLGNDLQPLLDQELSRLPDSYRAVIVLCELEGKTRKEAARQLALPEGTVASRLARARAMLAKRMAQRGVTLSGGALAAVLAQNVASAGVPTSVVSNTIQAATLVAVGQTAATGAISVKVAVLTGGVLKAMLMSKLKAAVAVVLVLGFMATGTTVLTYRTAAAQGDKPPTASDKPKSKPVDPAVALVQQLGDEDFATRETAGDKLRKLGVKARPALEAALRDPDPEIAKRSRAVLTPIRSDHRAAFAKQFDPKKRVEYDHPVWKHFVAIAGNSRASRELFARIVANEKWLRTLDDAEADPAAAGHVYRVGIAEVFRDFERDPARNPEWPCNRGEEVAYLLLLGSHPDKNPPAKLVGDEIVPTNLRNTSFEGRGIICGEGQILHARGLELGLEGKLLDTSKGSYPPAVAGAAGTDRVFVKLLAAWHVRRDPSSEIFKRAKALLAAQKPKAEPPAAPKSDPKPDTKQEKLPIPEKQVNAPQKQEKEAFTAWGKEVAGLQAGLGFRPGEKRAYSHGETVKLVVRVRNVGKEEVKFQYLRQFFIETPPAVTDGKGKPVPLGKVDAGGLVHVPVEVNLAPGKEIELYELKFELRPASESDNKRRKTLYGTGKFQIQYERVFGKSSSGSLEVDPTLSKLATGKLELEIKSDPPPEKEKKAPDAPVPAAKEPAWKAEFRKAYGLKDGEYVKRVPSPFIPERKDFVLPRFPGADEMSVKGLLTYGVLFVDADGKTLSYRAMVSTDATDFEDPPKAVRKKRLSLRSVLAYSTGRMTPEVVFNPRAKGQDVFMECDFVIRKGAPLEKLLPDLQKAIGKCELDNPKKHPVLTLKEEEQEVYVVRGKFKITPRKWRNKDEVDVYADEGVLNKEFTNANPEPTADVSTDINTNPPLQFVRELGAFVNKRMVWDGKAPTNSKFRAYTHSRWENKATAEEQAADRDPEKVLKNVSEQTGLTFTKEKRKVQVLYVVTP